jgi:hypothetical protein
MAVLGVLTGELWRCKGRDFFFVSLNVQLCNRSTAQKLGQQELPLSSKIDFFHL